jgi:hypothetical protein
MPGPQRFRFVRRSIVAYNTSAVIRNLSITLLFLVSASSFVDARPHKRPKHHAAPAPAPRSLVPSPSAPEPAAAAPVSAPAVRAMGPAPGTRAAADREVVKRESRIEFDERLVQGQTAAGAIYLFQRSESELRSMVRVPESFQDRTLRTVFPEQTSGPAR